MFWGMKTLHIMTLTALLAATAPVAAQEEEQDQGRSLMEQGAELFLEGLKREMAPALEDLQGLADRFGPSMRSFLQEMGPALGEMADQIKDWSAYHPPEILPNGDIIIRKKQPEPEAEETPPAPGETDI
jgi:hypothetical protein